MSRTREDEGAEKEGQIILGLSRMQEDKVAGKVADNAWLIKQGRIHDSISRVGVGRSRDAG